MGEIHQTSARAGLVAAVAGVAALAALQLGCASTRSQTPRGAEPEEVGAVSSARVATPAEIASLTVRAEGPGAVVDLVADRSLVWTSYRDADDNLVLELPNSLPGPEVPSMTPGEGLVESVEVSRLDDAERPLTRLVFHTRGSSEHTLTTEGTTLRVALVPAGGEMPVAVAEEPLPGDTGEAPAPPVRRPAPPAAAPAGRYGTPEEPYQAPAPAGVAATRLTGVDIERTGETTVVEILGDGEFSYATFRLDNPERFVIDLKGVVNTSPRSTVPVDSAAVDQIRIGQFKPRPEPVSRVVFDLRRFAPPEIERSSDGLKVRFGPPLVAETTLAEEVAAPGAPMAGAPPTEVAEVPPPGEPGAEAGTAGEMEGEGGAPPPVPVYQPPEPSGEPAQMAEQPPVRPPQMTAPTPAGAPPSAPAVSGPVSTSDVEMLEAQQMAEPPPAEKREPVLPQFESLVVSRQEADYVGEPLSMSLKDADLVEVLRSFAKISDLNFVIQPGVGGSVTVELHQVPWDQAMQQILKINNLGMDIDGTIVRIAPMDQLQAEAAARQALAAARQRAVPLRTVMRSLSYADANQVAGLLRSRTGAILSERGSVQVDQRTNTLIIRELPDFIDTVLAVIENLDTPEPQVTIEARIVEATKQFSRSLGIQWGFNGVADQQHGNTTGIEFPNNISADGNVALLTGGANGLLNLSLGNVLNTFTLDAQIQAAENEGLVNVISAPRVTTLNNNRASIQSGLQIPVQTVSNRTVTVQFVNATLQLSVTPHVTAEGTIQMDINVAKREPQLAFAIAGASNAPIATKEAQTRVIVRDGGTAVIGGIYTVSSNENEDRVPGLANVPIIKHLFKNKAREDSNEELMIFITPRIVQM